MSHYFRSEIRTNGWRYCQHSFHKQSTWARSGQSISNQWFNVRDRCQEDPIWCRSNSSDCTRLLIICSTNKPRALWSCLRVAEWWTKCLSLDWKLNMFHCMKLLFFHRHTSLWVNTQCLLWLRSAFVNTQISLMHLLFRCLIVSSIYYKTIASEVFLSLLWRPNQLFRNKWTIMIVYM